MNRHWKPHWGLAVRSEDLYGASGQSPVTLTVLGCNDAGSPAVHHIGRGEAAQIMTGSVLPGCKNIGRAVRRDDHTIEAVSWGITLHTSGILPAQFSHIGCRAHDFVPIYGARGENCIRFAQYEKAELPFEMNYYVAPERAAILSQGKAPCCKWRDLGEFHCRGPLLGWSPEAY